MIAYIKGNIEIKTKEYIIIEVNGIGYKIFMSSSAINELEQGKTAKIYTYLKVKEDDVSLYGFLNNEELVTFELLIGVGGIGAKSAITILSNITPSKFALAVITNNVNALKKLPGIGPKTAQRIILELKDKMKTQEAIEDEATDRWGCKVDRVEIQNITPPPDIRDAMEKQMNAERNKRASILQAEGERQAAVLKAQGEKEAAILQAEADKEAKIRRATGEAEAIRKVAEAKAEEVKLVYGAMMKANPDDKLVQLKSLEALKDVANGEANKVFIPFEATSALSAIGAATELLHDKKEENK